MLKSLSVWGLNVVKGRSFGSNRIATHRLWLTIMGILSVTLIVSVSSAQQTTRWNNPGGGYWDVAANWDNGVPDSTKIAVIDLPGTYTVTIRSNAVAAGLILGNDDPSDTGTKVLQVGASLTLNGDGLAKSRTIVALFDWGRLTGSGTLRVEGELRLRHGSIQEGSGVTWIAPSGKVTTDLGGGTTTLRRRLVNEGSVEIGLLSGTRSGGVLRLGQGGVLENKGMLRLRSYDPDTATIAPTDAPNAGKVVNEGIIESTQDSSRDTYITARLENRGTVRSRSHNLYLGDVVLLDGSRIGAGEGIVRVDPGGQVEVAEGATALVESGAVFAFASTLTGSSRLTGSGTLRVEGELRLGHGSIQEGSGVTWIAPSGKVTTDLGGGTTTLRRRLVNEGSVEIGLSGTYSGGVLRIGQGGVLENKGTLKLMRDYYDATIVPVDAPNSGKLVNEGIIENASYVDRPTYIMTKLESRGVIRSRFSILFLSDVLLLDGGRISAGEGTVQIADGSRVEVAEGATALVESGAVFIVGYSASPTSTSTLTGSGTLRVEGELRLEHGSIQEGSGVTWIAPSGKVTTDLHGGNTTLRRRLVNEGSVEIGLSGTYSGGVLRIGQGGVLENKGTLKLKSGYYAAQIAAVSPTDYGRLVNKGTIVKPEGDNTAYIRIDLRNEGKVQVSAGILEVSTYYQTQTGSLEIGIAGTQTSEYGRMNVTGSAWLNGSLIVSLLNNFAPSVGTSFQVLTVNQRTGDFRNEEIPGDMLSEWVDRSLKLTVRGGFFISSVSPALVPKADNIQMTLKGSGFSEGVVVILKRQDTEVTATEIAVEGRTRLIARFDLSNTPTGVYDVIVRLPDNQEAKFEDGVQVYDTQTLSILDVDPFEAVLSPRSIVTFTIAGTQFTPNCQVFLKRAVPGESPLTPQSVAILSSEQIQATFDLTRAKVGPYDIVIVKDNQQTSFRIHLYPYMAVMSDDYKHPSFLVVGRTVNHTIELTNFGNASGVGVYGLTLPQGFQLVGVQTGPGGEWGITSDGTIIIAQPVEAYSKRTITISVKLPWDHVLPPNEQPQEGKYRLGDKVFFKGSLIASPIQDIWPMIRGGAANWDDIVARAIVGYGTVRNLYLEELGELTISELSAHLTALDISHPGVGETISVAMRTNLLMSAIGNEYHGGRTRNSGNLTRSWDPGTIGGFVKDTWEAIKLMPAFIADDASKWQNWVVKGAATAEGLVEGLSFGLIKLNLSEHIAECLGVTDPLLIEGARIAGNVASFAVPAEGIFKVGSVALKALPGLPKLPAKLAGLAQDLKDFVAVTKFLYKSLKDSPEVQKYTQRLIADLDGTPIFRSLSKDIVWAIKGNPSEPTRIVGIDKIVRMPTETFGEAFPIPVRANIFHIGYHIQYGWHIGVGYVRSALKLGQEFPPAGWHFYKSHAFHPHWGDMDYATLVATPFAIAGAATPTVTLAALTAGATADFLSRLCNQSEGARIVAAYDPNSIEVSPEASYISPQQRLTFTVHFENMAQANFPAEDVTIKLVLDENFDIDTLTFDGFSHQDVVTTAIDKGSRTIFWRFTGINLPPNQNPPEGEGWAQFSVNLKQDVNSGAEIPVKAEIVFDENPPIVTNEVKVKVDSQPPNTQIVNLPTENLRGSFEVQWQAQDDLSGVAMTSLWVNEERISEPQRKQQNSAPKNQRKRQIGGREYTLYHVLSSESGTKVQFKGKFGYIYRLIAISKDMVGNEEVFPEQPQATTQVGRAPQITQGLRIVSVPVQSEDDDPKVVFNFPENKWAAWDPIANNGRGGYVVYP
ncbi:MAG: hypothetical protein QXH03_09165, partial [Candidatus Bathyarchaeia archaeon]